MRKDLVQIVCCPVHKSALKLTVERADEHGDILDGTLRCTACRFDYPIEDGIPNLLPPEYHVDEVKEPKAKADKPAGKVAKEDPAPGAKVRDTRAKAAKPATTKAAAKKPGKKAA